MSVTESELNNENAEVNSSETFVFATQTDVGQRRSENQDAYGYSALGNNRLFVVADGMGGARGGAVASTIAVNVVSNLAFNDLGEITEQSLRRAVDKANSLIFSLGVRDDELNGMGTTVVALAIMGNKAILAYVGDSRIYRIRGGELEQLSRDHTLVQELVDSGALESEEASSHPIAHMLTRSLGPLPSIEIDIVSLEDPIQKGDKYLLCCDGLYNHVNEDEILRLASNCPVEQGVRRLVDAANDGGGSDNITVQLLQVTEVPDAPTRLEQVGIPGAPPSALSVDCSDSLEKIGLTVDFSDIDHSIRAILDRNLPFLSPESDSGESASGDADGSSSEPTSHINGQASSSSEEQDPLQGIIFHGRPTGDDSLTRTSRKHNEKTEMTEEAETLGQAPSLESRQTVSWFTALMVVTSLVAAVAFVAYVIQSPKVFQGVEKTTVAKLSEDSISAPESSGQNLAPVAVSSPEEQLRHQPTKSEITDIIAETKRLGVPAPPPMVDNEQSVESEVPDPTVPINWANEQDLIEQIVADKVSEGAQLESKQARTQELITLREQEATMLKKREARGRISDIDARLRTFGFRSSREAEIAIEDLRQDLVTVEAAKAEVQKELATLESRQSIWQERSNALLGRTRDLVVIADEVALDSEVVSDAKRAHDNARARYLRAVAEWRASPNDNEKQSGMLRWGRDLQSARVLLEDVVKAAIEESLMQLRNERAESLITIEDLDAKRDRINRHIGFFQAVRGQSGYRRRMVEQRRLLDERRDLQGELRNLRTRLSDDREIELRKRLVTLRELNRSSNN